MPSAKFLVRFPDQLTFDHASNPNGRLEGAAAVARRVELGSIEEGTDVWEGISTEINFGAAKPLFLP